MKHTFLYVLFILIISGILSGMMISAAEEEFSGAYIEIFPTIESLTNNLPPVINDFSGVFDFSGDNNWNAKNRYNNTFVVSVKPGTAKRKYVSFNFDPHMDLQPFSILSFGIKVTVPDHTVSADSSSRDTYKVVLHAKSSDGSLQSYAYVAANQWTMTYFDLTEFKRLEEITALSIRVEYPGKTVPENIDITSLCADSQLEILDTFSSYAISPVHGGGILNKETVQLLPDITGHVSLSFGYIINSLPEPTNGFMLAVSLRGIKAAGTIAAGVQYKGSEEILTTAPITLEEGKQTYLLPLPASDKLGTMSTGDLDNYFLYLYNVEALEQQQIQLESVTIYTMPTQQEHGNPLPDAENMGTILSFGIAGNEIVFSGKMSRDAVIRHIDDTIVLYAVPAWDYNSMNNAIRLGECRVSNSYSITLPLASHRMYAENWMFFLAVAYNDPDNPEDTVLLAMNEPQFLNGRAPAKSALSILGLHNANAVGVFESNVSHVMVDIPLDQLLTKNGNTVCTRNGKSWHLNSALLTELSNKIQFYKDAGLEVCLQIYADKPIAGFTYTDSDAEQYLPNLSNEEAIEQYTAILSYLCKRYPSIDALMLGSGINSQTYTGIPVDESINSMSSIANLAALTYSTAAVAIPDIYLVVPFTDDYSFAEDLSEEERANMTPEFVSMLFATYLDNLGNIPWVFAYNFHRETEDTFALPDAIFRNLQQIGFSLPSDVIFMWIPDGEAHDSLSSAALVQDYADLCTKAAVVNPRALLLSLRNISGQTDQKMYSAMKDIHVENSSRVIWDYPAEITETVSSSLQSSITLYDFSASYGSLGWVAGGGISEMYTHYSPLFSELTPTRTLKTLLPITLNADGQTDIAGGVLLRNFSRTLDLRDVDEIIFHFALTDASIAKNISDTGATVIFLLGSQDRRAEYYAYSVPCGETLRVRCALDQYESADQISYVGIMLYANDTVELDLSSVSFGSNSLTQDALEEVFYGSEPEAPTTEHFTEIFYILIITMIITICIAVLLIRRDREETDLLHNQM